MGYVVYRYLPYLLSSAGLRATDLRLRHSQSRCYAGGFLSVSGLVPVERFHPPPCHALYLSAPALSVPNGRELISLRANHASTNPVPTSTQPLVLPRPAPLLSHSNLFLHIPISIFNPRPTTHRSRCRESESARESADEAPKVRASNDPSHPNRGSDRSFTKS